MTNKSTRDVPSGVMAAVVVALCLAGAIYTGFGLGGWWWLTWLLLVPLGLICVYGVVESFQAVPRDAKGKRL